MFTAPKRKHDNEFDIFIEAAAANRECEAIDGRDCYARYGSRDGAGPLFCPGPDGCRS
jgi:hypothetical protein